MKKKICQVFILISLVFMLSACGKKSIKLKVDNDHFTGMNFETAREEILEAGFTDVELVEMSDIASNSSMPDGGVSSVSIAGVEDYAPKDKFSPDSKVVITYHTIPKLSISLTEAQLENEDVDELLKTLQKDGFEKVSVKEEYDLDPDVNPGDTRELLINSSKIGVPASKEYPFDSKIEILT